MADRSKDDIAAALERMASAQDEPPRADPVPEAPSAPVAFETGQTSAPTRPAAPAPVPGGATHNPTAAHRPASPQPRPRDAVETRPTAAAAPEVARRPMPQVAPKGVDIAGPVGLRPTGQRSAPAWGGPAFRQTILPPALTLGVLLVATGVGSMLVSEDWALAGLSPLLRVGAIAGGVVLIGVAAWNALAGTHTPARS